MFLSRISKRLPLAWKLILTTTLPFFLLFVTLIFFVPYQMDQISLHSVEESLKLAISDTAGHFHNQAAITEPQRLNIQVVVYDAFLIPLRYYNYSYEVYPPESVDKLEMRETPGLNYRPDSTRGDAGFKVAEYTREIAVDGETYFFQASKNIDYRNDIVYYSQLISIVLFCIAVTLVFITSLISVKRNLVILRKIAETAESITISNLNSSIPYEQSNDEIGKMVQAFNKMVHRLDEAVTKQNHFLSDVSHEIKTPVAVIKGYVNMIRRWGYSDPAVFDEAVSAIDTSVNDITDIINNLLLLDNLKNNRGTNEFEKTDIGELLSKIIRSMQRLHPDRPLSLSIGKKRHTLCNAKLIAQAIRILTDNALKYSPDGSPLEVECRIDNRLCRIRICDHGDGIAEEEIPKVFGRFYRVEKSRSKETGGSGLGLAIAADIMAIHQGTIILTNRKNGGLCAEIQFPSSLTSDAEKNAAESSAPETADEESHT